MDLDTVLFLVDEEKFEQFADALRAQPSLNPGLERLLALPAPWASENE